MTDMNLICYAFASHTVKGEFYYPDKIYDWSWRKYKTLDGYVYLFDIYILL